MRDLYRLFSAATDSVLIAFADGSLAGGRSDLVVGLERQRRAGLGGGCGWRGGCALGALAVLGVLRLRLEYAANPRAERCFAGRGGRAVRATFGLERLGRRVVGNVIAANLVAAFFEQRVVEQLDEPLLSIVDDALRESLVILVDTVAFFAECHRIAIGGRGQRVVRVLVECDPIGVNRERALSDVDVAAAGVALEVDRFVAVGLFFPHEGRDATETDKGAANAREARGQQRAHP